MALEVAEKERIISHYQRHEGDTGSSDVQIALLTERIKQLTAHLKNAPNDKHSRKGLLNLVSQRRRKLDYLKNKDLERYKNVIRSLGIRG